MLVHNILNIYHFLIACLWSRTGSPLRNHNWSFQSIWIVFPDLHFSLMENFTLWKFRKWGFSIIAYSWLHQTTVEMFIQNSICRGCLCESCFRNNTTIKRNSIWELGRFKKYQMIFVYFTNYITCFNVKLLQDISIKLFLIVKQTWIFV